MLNNFFIPLSLSFVLLTNSPLISAQMSPFLFGSQRAKHVEVNNRVLGVVNGNPITVYDLMKKLDMIFYKQFPQYAESVDAKYEFYQYNWKDTLRDLIDKELILADAEEIKLEITGGDIRQEMETVFGPNIIANLDRLGMTYNEAYELIKGEITIQRMIGARVSGKAQRKLTPQALLSSYQEFAKKNQRTAEWDYQIISIRHEDPTRSAEIGNTIYNLIKTENLSIDALEEKIKQSSVLDSQTKFQISRPLHHTEKEVSDKYKSVLSTLEPKNYSAPQVHTLRNSDQKVVRIFYLDQLVPGGAVPFREVESKLSKALQNKAMDEESEFYLNNLRKHFHVDEEEILSHLPDNFQPFTLL